MRFTRDLRVIALATLITLASVHVQPATVVAADPPPAPVTGEPSPTPVPTPVTEEPSPAPSTDPAPEPSADAVPEPTPDPDPAPSTEEPEPTPDPDPATDPSPPTDVVPPLVIRPDYSARVVRIAVAQRHDRYVRGATGPNRFDCSGLVRFSYKRAGVGGHLGGGHSARSMLRWGRLHGRTSRHHPHIGDVAIYGNGTHAAIYIGNGRVISALNPRQGIRITRLHALGARFTTFIHTDI